MSQTPESITSDLFKSSPFSWDAHQQTDPQKRLVSIDASAAPMLGKVALSAQAALRCGAQVEFIAAEKDIASLSMSLPESTFVTESSKDAVVCDLKSTFDGASKVVTIGSGQNCIRITMDDDAQPPTEKEAALIALSSAPKVLLSERTFVADQKASKDQPRPFVSAGEYVLAGLCSAMLARGLAPETAAVWGFYVYDLALCAAAKDLKNDMIQASDVLPRIATALRYATKRNDSPTRSGLRPG